jgi:hypothetical protein
VDVAPVVIDMSLTAIAKAAKVVQIKAQSERMPGELAHQFVLENRVEVEGKANAHSLNCTLTVLIAGVHAKVYGELDPDTEQIRTVRILSAAQSDDELRCELAVTSLHKQPVYKALSYTWGDANDTVPIILNGRCFYVTRNLERALRRLQSANQESVYWIDAISINQTDVAERTQQVSLMRKIYEMAEEVFVWIGSAAEFDWNDIWKDSRLHWTGDDGDIDGINNMLHHVEELANNSAVLGPSSGKRILLAFCFLRLLAGDVHPLSTPLLSNASLRGITMKAVEELGLCQWVSWIEALAAWLTQVVESRLGRSRGHFAS